MKKLVALVLVLIMLVAMLACTDGSGIRAKNPAVGTWTLTGLFQGEEDYSFYLAMMGMEINMVLNEDGTGYMESMGQKLDLTWDASSITFEGESISYTVEGDQLAMEESGEKMVFTRK